MNIYGFILISTRCYTHRLPLTYLSLLDFNSFLSSLFLLHSSSLIFFSNVLHLLSFVLLNIGLFTLLPVKMSIKHFRKVLSFSFRTNKRKLKEEHLQSPKIIPCMHLKEAITLSAYTNHIPLQKAYLPAQHQPLKWQYLYKLKVPMYSIKMIFMLQIIILHARQDRCSFTQ